MLLSKATTNLQRFQNKNGSRDSAKYLNEEFLQNIMASRFLKRGSHPYVFIQSNSRWWIINSNATPITVLISKSLYPIATHHISRFWLRHFFEYFILSASIPLKWKYIRRFLLFKVNWSQALSRCDRGIFVMFVISRVDGSRTNLSLSLSLSFRFIY